VGSGTALGSGGAVGSGTTLGSGADAAPSCLGTGGEVGTVSVVGAGTRASPVLHFDFFSRQTQALAASHDARSACSWQGSLGLQPTNKSVNEPTAIPGFMG
jgi:hypothetical protein